MKNEKGIFTLLTTEEKGVNAFVEFTAIHKAMENPQTDIKVVDEPSLVSQSSMSRRNVRYPNRPAVHFQRRSHSHSQCPWPLARQPYRGDYSIHQDWHPRLPHHRLTCLC